MPRSITYGKPHPGELTGVLLLSLEETVDLVANFTVGHLDIILEVTIIVHEGEETVIGDVKLVRDISIPPFIFQWRMDSNNKKPDAQITWGNGGRELTSWNSRRLT